MKTLIVLAPVLWAFCTGCSISDRPIKSPVTKADFLEVEFFVSPNDRQVFGFTLPAQVNGVAKWVEEIRPPQPPATSIGAVGPWCKITFFESLEFRRRAVSSITVYTVQDRKAGEELITPDQRRKLLSILDLVETGNRQYARKPAS